MKTIKKLLLIIIAFLLFNACKKDAKPLTVTDYDGNVYKTVKIGNQIWMAENLKTTHYRNGDPIENVVDAQQWAAKTAGAYCVNPDVPDYAKIYGHLYNWYAVDARDGDNKPKLAPEGWHVATDTDWTTLINELGGEDEAGGKLKEAGLQHWTAPNPVSNTITSFKALPGGSSGFNSFSAVTQNGIWWTSTESSINNTESWRYKMYNDDPSISRDYSPKYFGYSIRCVKD